LLVDRSAAAATLIALGSTARCLAFERRSEFARGESVEYEVRNVTLAVMTSHTHD
jgi:hypothetical protein